MTRLPQSSLQAGASAESLTRYAIAQELVAACPLALGEEIAVTGSVAMGLADETSDIELNMWVGKLPSVEERAAWIAQIGGTEAQISPREWSDGTLNATFRFRDVWVEAGWMTTAQVAEALRGILAAEILGHSRLQFAWVVEHAVALRSAGRLAGWQRALGTYPDLLAERLVETNTQVWQLPHAMLGRWTYCRRGQPMALTERLTWDVYNVLRVVFALSHRWEPDFKWLRHVTRDLVVAPERLAGRIEDIFTLPVLEHRVATSLALIQDTLALAPPTSGIVRARATIQHCLERAPAGGPAKETNR